LRHLLRGIRLGDHVAGGIQHRLDDGAIKSSGKPDDDPATVVGQVLGFDDAFARP
jgi:hypothetical protein